MNSNIRYRFSAKIWRYKSQGGWFFVSLPLDLSEEIRSQLKWQEEGWGRMKATARIEKIEWETAIWFDSKLKTYLLPLKKEIRIKAQLKLDDEIPVEVSL